MILLFFLTIWQEFAPSDEEIQAYRKEEEWDPEKAKLAAKQKVLVGLGLLCLIRKLSSLLISASHSNVLY
jgi:hypothetical protein